MLSVTKYGDWSRAGAVLRGLSVNLFPSFKAQIREDGELVLKTIVGHIDRQDLNWTPLAERTIQLKNGDETIYVESGYLRDNLEVRKIKSSSKDVSYFVGASAWKTTPSGLKFSDLMIWLEYGTDKIPARPLIRPSWEEVEPILHKNWEKVLKELIERGG